MNENLPKILLSIWKNLVFVNNTKSFLDVTEFIPSSPALTAVLNNDVIQVSWDKPEDNPHRVDHYELYWQGSDSPSTPEQVSLVRHCSGWFQCQKPANVSFICACIYTLFSSLCIAFVTSLKERTMFQDYHLTKIRK